MQRKRGGKFAARSGLLMLPCWNKDKVRGTIYEQTSIAALILIALPHPFPAFLLAFR
jgi:hypothetical protein